MAKQSSPKTKSVSKTENEAVDLTAAIAPIAIIGGTFIARKAAEVLYKAATGKQPPRASDPEAKATSVLTWTLAVAGAVALTEMAISRVLPEKK